MDGFINKMSLYFVDSDACVGVKRRKTGGNGEKTSEKVDSHSSNDPSGENHRNSAGTDDSRPYKGFYLTTFDPKSREGGAGERQEGREQCTPCEYVYYMKDGVDPNTTVAWI